MAHANVGDLSLLDEAVADHVPRPLLLGIGKQDDRRIDMREVMLGLCNLRLIRRDPPVNLGALVLQRLDDQRFRHADHHPTTTAYKQTQTWCACCLRPKTRHRRHSVKGRSPIRNPP